MPRGAPPQRNNIQPLQPAGQRTGEGSASVLVYLQKEVTGRDPHAPAQPQQGDAR